MWGVGFFIVVNRAVIAEDSWLKQARIPSLISVFATLGVFSYSIYLTHELTIMESWRWVNPALGQIQNVFLIVLPATILAAWTFFWFCERPFMTRKTAKTPRAERQDRLTLLETDSRNRVLSDML